MVLLKKSNGVITAILLILLLMMSSTAWKLGKDMVFLKDEVKRLNVQLSTVKTHTSALRIELGKKNLELDQKMKLLESKDKEIQLLIQEIEKLEKSKPVSRGDSRTPQSALFEVTMYTNAGGAPPYKGMMASGEYTRYGVVAAPKSLPFGTLIEFEGVPNGWEYLNTQFVVKDRGGAIKEKTKDGEKVYCIDVWCDDKEMAKNWGRRTIRGWIIPN